LIKQGFLNKAKENLTVAEWAYNNGHYNVSAKLSYYATFQAAIAALAHVNIMKTERKIHESVQINFATELIHKRKIYPNDLKSYLATLQEVRNKADYESEEVSAKVAGRQLKKAQEFVKIILQELEK